MIGSLVHIKQNTNNRITISQILLTNQLFKASLQFIFWLLRSNHFSTQSQSLTNFNKITVKKSNSWLLKNSF